MRFFYLFLSFFSTPKIGHLLKMVFFQNYTTQVKFGWKFQLWQHFSSPFPIFFSLFQYHALHSPSKHLGPIFVLQQKRKSWLRNQITSVVNRRKSMVKYSESIQIAVNLVHNQILRSRCHWKGCGHFLQRKSVLSKAWATM